jgi:hypothetical protein
MIAGKRIDNPAGADPTDSLRGINYFGAFFT